jgi:hypothetical protein
LLWLWLLVLLNAPARAHDLAIDQVMLWPDREAGELRGEITFDPELTRSKDAVPTDEDARRALAFLNANLALTFDGASQPLRFEVRELWVRGGATLGDVVRFSAPLAASVRELRLHASAFEALVVSMQRVPSRARSSAPAAVETTSWLLGKDEWTPVYRLDGGWQASGWRVGGPDVFIEGSSGQDAAANPSAAAAPSNTAVSNTAVSNAAVSNAALSAPRAPSDGDEARAASATGLAARFVRLGFEHILPCGIDHVLFVAALVLACARRYRQVLISLSLFTLAHTLTLALGHFRLVQLPAQVVEPLIAFSIVVLGVENLRASRSLEVPAGARHLVVFCFGLVHGLGFASALSALAFDPRHIVLALFSFNLGVELGQVVVVALVASLLLLIRRWRKLERYATLAGSAAIAASGLVMVAARLSQADAAASALPSVSIVPLSQSPSPSLDRSL